MQRKKQVFVAVTIAAASLGGTLGRLHLVGPNAGTYFVLGIFATLSVIGIGYGFWEAKRIVRNGTAIGD